MRKRVPDRPGFRADASAEPAASHRQALSPRAQGRVLTRPPAVPPHSQQRAPGPARPLQTRGFRVGERGCDSGLRRHLRGPGSVPPGASCAENPRPGAEAAGTVRDRSREVERRRRRRREERGRRRRRRRRRRRSRRRRRRGGGGPRLPPPSGAAGARGTPAPAALSPPSHAFRPHLGQ